MKYITVFSSFCRIKTQNHKFINFTEYKLTNIINKNHCYLEEINDEDYSQTG